MDEERGAMGGSTERNKTICGYLCNKNVASGHYYDRQGGKDACHKSNFDV